MWPPVHRPPTGAPKAARRQRRGADEKQEIDSTDRSVNRSASQTRRFPPGRTDSQWTGLFLAGIPLQLDSRPAGPQPLRMANSAWVHVVGLKPDGSPRANLD